MRTKQSSSSLRKMSDSDLDFLALNIESGVTFSGVKGQLKKVYNAIERMYQGKTNKADYEAVRHFGYGYAGYDDLWVPYQKKDYKKCLEVLKKDISEVTKKTNKARMTWMITSGVVSEIRRRKWS